MRDPQQFPNYLLVDVGEGEMVRWRIQRRSDMAICAVDRNYTMTDDDGEVIDVIRDPKVRDWTDSNMASAYLTSLNDGVAREPPDEPVEWVPEVPFFTHSDPMLVDGPL